MRDPSQPAHPVHLGNVYTIAATVAATMLSTGRADPWCVIVERDGTITAYPVNDRMIGDPGFVGWVSEDTDPIRFAKRLAAAHAKVAAWDRPNAELVETDPE